MIKKEYIYLLTISLFLTGCTSVQTTQEWERVKAFTIERTGREARWEQTEEDVKATKEEVNKLLPDGLTEDDAVRIALLNNRKLQASFEEIGVTKADLVQVGLFTNPKLTAVFRFPFKGGGTDIEAVLPIRISDLWQIPLRKKVAAIRLEATMIQMSEEILKTVAEAKKAHSEYVALLALRDETEKIKKQMEELRDHLIYRQKFGYTSDLDIYMAKAAIIDKEAELARIQKESKVARMRLNRVLGLCPDQFGYEVIGSLPEEFRPLPDLEIMITHALSMRPDVQIAKLKIEDSRRVLALERKRIFTNVEAGIGYARESEGTEFFGPELEIQLPLFDQNQAQIAKAEYRVRQAEKELQAKIGVVREEVSAALERLSFARREVNLIRNQILPMRKGSVGYAEKYFNAMQINMLYLLEARQKLSETQRRFIESLREQQNAIIELERILGGMILRPEVEHKGH